MIPICRTETDTPHTTHAAVTKNTAVGWSTPLLTILRYNIMLPSGFGENAALKTLKDVSTIGIAKRPSGRIMTVAKAIPLLAPNTDVPAKSVPHMAASGDPRRLYTFTCLLQKTKISAQLQIDIMSASENSLEERSSGSN